MIVVEEDVAFWIEYMRERGDISKEDFLNIMARSDTFSKAKYIVRI
jgi:hypothetical protein